MKKSRAASSANRLLKIIFLKNAFIAFQKTPESEEIIKQLEESDEKTGFERIRCPLCQWKPQKSSRWWCADCDAPEYFYGGCDTAWNTFETRGKCPTCAYQWIFTSCLKCGGWSPHEDWYEIKKD